jgi:hypothetical protein
VQFLRHLDPSSISFIELAVIVTQGVRLVGVAAYYRTRPARAEVLLILLSFETFVVMGLIVLYLVTPDPLYSQLARNIFSTWTAALFTVIPSYLIFAGVNLMARKRSLTTVLLSITLEFGFLIFIATLLMGFGSTFTLGGFFDFVVAVTKSEISIGTIPALSTLSILVPSVVVYCSLLVYSTIPSTTSAVQPKVTFLLPLLSAAVALVWVYAAVLIVPNSLLSFTVPGLTLVVVLWGFMRR